MIKLAALLSVGLVCTTLSLYAQPSLGHADFDPFADASTSGGTTYAVGTTLVGQTNAQGLAWVSAGPGTNLNQPMIVAGNLTIPGLPAPTGNSVGWGAVANGQCARLNLGTTLANSTFNSGTVYVSMAYKMTALGGLPTTPVFFAGFNNSFGPTTTTPSVFGAKIFARKDGTGYDLGINKQDGTAADIVWEPTPYAIGQTIFIVASYTFSGTPASLNDSVSMWVNPSTNTFGAAIAPTADLTTAAGANIATPTDQIASFILRESITTEPGGSQMDGIYVGLSWADVTPVPPAPTTPPSFSNLAANSTTGYGTNVSLSGTLSAPGPIFPAMGETVAVSVNGVGNTQTTTITDTTGDFTINFNPGTTPVSVTPYTLTYTYNGNGTLGAATNTSTTLTVNAPKVVTLAGSRPFDGTSTALAGMLNVSDALSGDVVTVASGSATLAGTGPGAEAITSLGSLTLGGAAATNYTLSGAIGTVTISTPPFTAGHPVFEPFNDATASNGTSYAINANLVGQTNAQGLSWLAAGNGAGGQPMIASGALTIPGLLAVSTNSVQYGGVAGTTARLDLGTATTNSTFVGSPGLTLYYSMAFEVNALGSLSSTPAVISGFNNTAGTQTSQPGTIAARLYLRLDGSGYDIGIDKADGIATNITWETNVYSTGTPYFIVAAYTFSGTPSAANDSASLWVSPNPATFGAVSAPVADVTTTNGSNIGANSVSDIIASFILREAATTEPAIMTVDQLSIGTTWADVTPPTASTTFKITSESVSGANFVLTWSSVPGTTYHVVGSPVVNTPVHTWTNVGVPIIASGTSTSATNPVSGATNFYSVISP